MADTLTESFCERCGTRYEFKAPTRLNPMRKTRGMVGGLKNYLTSQDSFSDSMTDSMRTEQGALASAQLEAFHESFNFCIDCRQYTCLNCWNDDAGRCRTCLPVAGVDDVPDTMPAAPAIGAEVMATDVLQARLGSEAWPTIDLPSAAATDRAQLVESWPSAEPLAAAEATAVAGEGVLADDGFVYDTPRIELDEPDAEELVAAVVEPEPVVAEVEPEPETVLAEVEPQPVVAEVEPEPETVLAEVEEPVAADVEAEPEPDVAQRPPLRVLSWEPDGAFDVEVAAMVAAVEPEPIVAAVEPEPIVAEVEPEPVVAEVEPEPVAAIEPERRTPVGHISQTILRFPERQAAQPPAPGLAAQDDSPELAARRAQLEGLGLGDPGTGPVLPEPPAIVPYRSRGAAMPQGEIAARAVAQGVSFWEASAREVANATAIVGVQNCSGCGLSLSASARFCRRCGTPQAQSA